MTNEGTSGPAGPPDRLTEYPFVILGVIVLAGFLAGVLISHWTNADRVGIGVSLAVPAVASLYGVLAIKDDVKQALAVTFASVYFLFLVSVEAIFLFGGSSTPDTGFAKVLTDNFTSLFGVVIATYFGAEAAKHIAGTPDDRATARSKTAARDRSAKEG
jgi:hypothetical protein